MLRGRVPVGVPSGGRGPCWAEGVHPRPGAGGGRGSGAATVARSCGPDAAALARARRGGVLLDVLLRFGHAVLSGSRRLGRPDADFPRAGALRVLARVGASTGASTADRAGRRPRDPAVAWGVEPGLVGGRAVRARRCGRGSAPAPVRREPLVERPREPGPRPTSARPDPRRARPARRRLGPVPPTSSPLRA